MSLPGQLTKAAEDSAENRMRRNLKLVVSVQVIENGRWLESSMNEKTWHQELVVVPLDRVAALDVQDMVERALRNVVVIAGQDGKD